MKTQRINLRAEPSVRRYLERAAKFDRRSLSSLMMMGAMEYADSLRKKGWGGSKGPSCNEGRAPELPANDNPRSASEGESDVSRKGV